MLTLRPQLGQIKLARFAIQIRKAQSKSATPPRGRHLSTICSSHSPAHHPKCKSCASETPAPLHLINATSCSIKQSDASPPSSSFKKKDVDNKLLWQCLGTTLLPKLLTLHICFVHSPPPLPGIIGQRPANTQALASSNSGSLAARPASASVSTPIQIPHRNAHVAPPAAQTNDNSARPSAPGLFLETILSEQI